MPDPDRTAELRHAIANPLCALLSEAQLILTGDAPLDEETREGLQQIEKLALCMRSILKDSNPASSPPASTPVQENR